MPSQTRKKKYIRKNIDGSFNRNDMKYMKKHFPKDFERWTAKKQQNRTCKRRKVKTIKDAKHNSQCDKKYRYIDNQFLL